MPNVYGGITVKTHTLLAEIVCSSSGRISKKAGNTCRDFSITTVIISYHCYPHLASLPLLPSLTTVITQHLPRISSLITINYHCYHHLPPSSLITYRHYRCHQQLSPSPLLSSLTTNHCHKHHHNNFYQHPTSNGSQGCISGQRCQITSRIVFRQPAHW